MSTPRDILVPANNWVLIFTDIAIELPVGSYGRIAPRSGLAAAHGITVDAGVIDRDYTGNVGVVVVNRSNQNYQIHAGDRIAQLICERALQPVIREQDSLSTSCVLPTVGVRGSKGFGSSGGGMINFY